jgi:hypothetical protein
MKWWTVYTQFIQSVQKEDKSQEWNESFIKAAGIEKYVK